ncbi:PIN domain-containing protein [Natrinema salsiterrestre]|uniref:PIN domain-containing protein n=1 Tax=Natrinema salsiterrestre TaxID=2950540 RepID=A0A9Q4L828_9EURY|nr:PIN domain-containing protein [Natrinema salsiterrestre]MDF9747680.1 PIN domain-containing protein [Natrinema salsiterrestre]
MTEYVFDAEPLIAFLYDEPGAVDVSDRLKEIDEGEATGALAHATATELVYKVARLETGAPNRATPGGDELETGERDLRVLQGYGLTIETPPWSTVARIKAAGGIALGDSYAAALAADRDATLIVGADPEFGDLSVDVTLHRIRDEPA